MKNLYLDIETIPTQLASLKDEVVNPVIAQYAEKERALKAELEGIKPPSNYKEAAAIEKWNANERPKKEEGLRAQISACQAECIAKVDEAWRRTSFDGAYGQVVVIGFALDDNPPTTLWQPKDFLTPKAEAMVLRDFFKMLGSLPAKDAVSMTWIGHNIIDFDLRFMFQRAVIHGIQPPFIIPFDAKPWGDRVFDTMLAWAGGRGRVGQDKLCRVLGIDAKGSELGDEIDGSKVWDYIKDGRIADVAKYCGGDVNRARDLHRRLTFTAA